MATQTPIYGIRFPEDTDSPDIPRDFGYMGADVEKALLEGLPRFANAAARDAAYAANGGAQPGMTCWMADTNLIMQYISGVWTNLATSTIGAINFSNPTLTSSPTALTEAVYAATVKLNGITRTGNTLVAPVTGTYSVNVWAGFATNPNGTHRVCALQVNGGNPPYMVSSYIGIPDTAFAGLGQGGSASGYYTLTAGSAVRCVLRQDCGVPLAVTGGFGIRLV